MEEKDLPKRNKYSIGAYTSMNKEFYNDSWIVKVSYDTDTKKMVVQTKIKTYECDGVPEDVYDAFDRASSRGAFFNENIKGRYLDKLFK